jgi:primase-polymerase (primpol)-like protein
MIARPQALPVNFGGIPDDIRAHPDWVLWGYIFEDGVWKKMPFTTSIKRASTSDPKTWTSFDEVWDFAMLNPDYGIGIVLTQNIDGIDLDDCRDASTGELTEIANKTLSQVDGYAEVSPSGTGIKLFTISNLAASSQVKGVKDNLGDQETQIDIELYKHNTGRFFTVTGHALNGHNALPMFEQDVGWLVEMTGAKN